MDVLDSTKALASIKSVQSTKESYFLFYQMRKMVTKIVLNLPPATFISPTMKLLKEIENLITLCKKLRDVNLCYFKTMHQVLYLQLS